MRTEREKMLAGELYDPFDPELVVGRVPEQVVPGQPLDAFVHRLGHRE